MLLPLGSLAGLAEELICKEVCEGDLKAIGNTLEVNYEAFFDEYVEYMKAYNDNPTDAELLMGMSDMLAREADMIKAFDEWEEDHDMTTAEEAYYLEVHSRIYAKLAEVM